MCISADRREEGGGGHSRELPQATASLKATKKEVTPPHDNNSLAVDFFFYSPRLLTYSVELYFPKTDL